MPLSVIRVLYAANTTYHSNYKAVARTYNLQLLTKKIPRYYWPCIRFLGGGLPLVFTRQHAFHGTWRCSGRSLCWTYRPHKHEMYKIVVFHNNVSQPILLEEARDIGALGWQWQWLDHMQTIRTTLQMPTPFHTIFTGHMLFLMLNQQHQSTEGISIRQATLQETNATLVLLTLVNLPY